MKRFTVTVNGTPYDVQVEEVGDAARAAAPRPAAPAPKAPAPAVSAPAGTASVTIESPMPGSILDVRVSVGQKVAAREVLLVLEAMKMENDIVAPEAGSVSAIHVGKGDAVDTGTPLISLA